MKKLEGKIAVITGGSSGIGLATAQRFVQERAHVYISGRRQSELDQAVKQIGNNVTGVQGDVSNLADLDRLYDTVKEQEGRIDVLFANARAHLDTLREVSKSTTNPNPDFITLLCFEAEKNPYCHRHILKNIIEGRQQGPSPHSDTPVITDGQVFCSPCTITFNGLMNFKEQKDMEEFLISRILVMSKKLYCAECKKEIPPGCMAVSYDNKFFDNYQCLAVFKGVNLDGSSLSSIMDKSTLKTIIKE